MRAAERTRTRPCNSSGRSRSAKRRPLPRISGPAGRRRPRGRDLPRDRVSRMDGDGSCGELALCRRDLGVLPVIWGSTGCASATTEFPASSRRAPPSAAHSTGAPHDDPPAVSTRALWTALPCTEESAWSQIHGASTGKSPQHRPASLHLLAAAARQTPSAPPSAVTTDRGKKQGVVWRAGHV